MIKIKHSAGKMGFNKKKLIIFFDRYDQMKPSLEIRTNNLPYTVHY